MGKKTLYLDLDMLDRTEELLARLPGSPSLSAFLTEQLPMLADNIEVMVEALEKGGVRGFAALVNTRLEDMNKLSALSADVAFMASESPKAGTPLSELVPPKKGGKQGKPSMKKVRKP